MAEPVLDVLAEQPEGREVPRQMDETAVTEERDRCRQPQVKMARQAGV